MVGHPSCRLISVSLFVIAFMGSGLAGTSTGARAEPAGPAAVAAARVPLNNCVIPDNRPPRLRGLTLSSAKLDLRRGPRRLTVHADVVDAGGPGPASGIRRVHVYLGTIKFSGARSNAFVALRPQPDGSWSGSARFVPGTAPGRWVIELVRVKDKAGLETSYNRAALARLGIADKFTVAGPTDREAPRLRALHLSRTVLNQRPGQGGSVRVRVKASDDLHLREVFIAGIDAPVPTPLVHETPGVVLRRTRSGSWVGRMTFPRWNARGRYHLVAFLEDGIGDLSAYGGDPATRRPPIPGPHAITVRGGQVDSSRPRIEFTQLPSSPIDIRTADQVVNLEVRLRDTGSGVSDTEVTFDMYEDPIPLRRVSGTSHDGLWQAQVRVSHCAPPEDTTLFVKAEDLVGHNQTLTSSPLRLITSDHRPPEVNDHKFKPRRTGPLRFEWTENVAGISTKTAPLLPDDAGSARTRVPGAWTCQTATHTPVDCVTGPVRFSTFTPRVKLTAHCYDALFNPPGVLSVTDLAGNPARDPVYWCFK